MKRLNGKFSTEVQSIHGNKYAQVFSHKNGFGVCYPLTRLTGDAIGQQLQHFCFDWGIPEFLKSDGHPSQTGPNTLFQKLIRLHQNHHTLSEPYRPNQNPAEGTIREIKKRWYPVMYKKNVPKRVWDYGLVWICETGNLSVSQSHYANGRISLEDITGETPDISEYTDFSFYDCIIYKDNAGLGVIKLG